MSNETVFWLHSAPSDRKGTNRNRPTSACVTISDGKSKCGIGVESAMRLLEALRIEGDAIASEIDKSKLFTHMGDRGEFREKIIERIDRPQQPDSSGPVEQAMLAGLHFCVRSWIHDSPLPREWLNCTNGRRVQPVRLAAFRRANLATVFPDVEHRHRGSAPSSPRPGCPLGSSCATQRANRGPCPRLNPQKYSFIAVQAQWSWHRRPRPHPRWHQGALPVP